MAYFANGSEGDYLEAQCAECPVGEKACPIKLVQLMHNYNQLRAGNSKLQEAMETLIDSNGDCQMRPLLVTA